MARVTRGPAYEPGEPWWIDQICEGASGVMR